MASAAQSTTRLFVHNLPWSVNPQKLKTYFSRFGDIELSTVVFDKNTGFSRGYGFINFTNKIGSDAALNEQKHILDGQIVGVSPSKKN